MTLQRRLERIVSELEDLRDDCRWTNERELLDDLISRANMIALRSDW